MRKWFEKYPVALTIACIVVGLTVLGLWSTGQLPSFISLPVLMVVGFIILNEDR